MFDMAKQTQAHVVRACMVGNPAVTSSNPAVTLSEHKEKGISVLQDDKRRIVTSTCAILSISSLVHNFHNSSIFLAGPKGEPGPPGPKGSSGT